MNFKFTNSVLPTPEELVVNKKLMPAFPAYRRRVNSQRRYAKDGGVIVGDQYADIRDIILDFDIAKTADSDFRDEFNNYVGFFNLDKAPFYLHDTDNSIRTNIVLESIAPKTAPGTEYRVGSGKITIKMLDSFWEDENEISVSPTGGLANGETYVVNNDSVLDAFPVITVTAKSNNQLFLIRNETTGEQFEIGSNFFVTDSEFIVSSVDGTIYLDDGTTQVESSAALADGSGMIKLKPGNNTLKYESTFGDIDLQVDFRRRYVF